MPWTFPSPINVTLLGFLLLLFAPLVTAQQPPPWPESNKNYNSPMATALIVMIIVFFSVGFISVYLRHFIACLGFDAYGGLRRGGGGARARDPPNRGLDPTILNTFPTFLYSDVKIHRVGKITPLECAVCISEFADNEILRLLPKCNHVFHPHCVDLWLASNVTCPVCRANLEIQPYSNNSGTSDDDGESVGRRRPQAVASDNNNNNNNDQVIIRVEETTTTPTTTIPGTEGMVKSPTQELLHRLNLSESGRIIRLPRSHSTGHSLVGDSDRFTLRLPEEVRNKLIINDNNNNYNYNYNYNAIVSPRVGYRPTNMGCTDPPNKPDRWRFSMSPPFISRPNSPKLESPTTNNNNSNSNNTPGRLLRSPKSLFRSLKSPNKSPLHRVVSCNDIGERSSNRLWDNRSPQDLDLEDQDQHSHKQQFG